MIVKYFSPKLIHHVPGGDFNLEQIKQIGISLYKSFPDAYTTIDDIMATGDKVIVRQTVQATHKGEYLGVAPTGKKVKILGLAIYRIVNGKIVETWFASDIFDLMIQLGAIPNPFVPAK